MDGPVAAAGDRDVDQDLANDFMRKNFDPPDNLVSMRENAQIFCQRVPKEMKIVLISVSKLVCDVRRSMT